MKPRIAIPQVHTNAEYAAKAGPPYATAVEQAGGEPVLIPLAADNREIMRLIMSCDGVLLPGSRADVDPEKYGQQRQGETHDGDPARDNVDELLLQDAYNMHKPILAICFGMQILNVWRTGTLVQHLTTTVQHTGNSALRHKVRIAPESYLAELLGDEQITTNTSHHQAVATPGDGLRVVAWSADDNVIEAMEGTNPEHLVIAVQWHPERLVDDQDPHVRSASRAFFSALVEAAQRRRQSPRTPLPDFEDVSS